MRTRIVPITLLLMPLLAVPACSPPIGTWDSAEPEVRIQLMAQAVRDRDTTRVPILIQSLENDDPLVRLCANDALQRLTGQDFGFRYYDRPAIRSAAVVKWRQWLAESSRQGNTSDTAKPSSASATSAGPAQERQPQ